MLRLPRRPLNPREDGPAGGDAAERAAEARGQADAAAEEHKPLSDAMSRHGHSVGLTMHDGIMVVDVLFQGRARDVPGLARRLTSGPAEAAGVLNRLAAVVRRRPSSPPSSPTWGGEEGGRCQRVRARDSRSRAWWACRLVMVRNISSPRGVRSTSMDAPTAMTMPWKTW